MTHVRFAAAVAASLALGPGAAARAESNNPAAVELPPAARVIQGGGIGAGGGSEAYPAFAAGRSTVMLAGDDLLLPGNGDGPVQTAASLPRGAMEGTAAYVQAQSVARFLAGREERSRVAARHPAGTPRG